VVDDAINKIKEGTVAKYQYNATQQAIVMGFNLWNMNFDFSISTGDKRKCKIEKI
jgi:hypothetical protein